MKIFYLTSKELNHDIAVQIKDGDICVINDSNMLYVCIVFSEPSQTIPLYSPVYVAYSKKIQLDISVYNPLIFANDGVDKRYGNVYVLKEIMNQIDSGSIHNFFQECIAIASYKEDRFSSNFILEFFHHSIGKLEIHIHPKPYQAIIPNHETATVKEDSCTISKEKSEKKKKVNTAKSYEIKAHPSEFYFYDFLDQPTREEWVKLYNEKMTVRNIFYELKAKYKLSFRQALKKFNNEHTDLNIYSLKPCSMKRVDSGSFNHQTNELDFLFEELANRGFTQISSEIWEDKRHKRYHISIQEL